MGTDADFVNTAYVEVLLQVLYSSRGTVQRITGSIDSDRVAVLRRTPDSPITPHPDASYDSLRLEVKAKNKLTATIRAGSFGVHAAGDVGGDCRPGISSVTTRTEQGEPAAVQRSCLCRRRCFSAKRAFGFVSTGAGCRKFVKAFAEAMPATNHTTAPYWVISATVKSVGS